MATGRRLQPALRQPSPVLAGAECHIVEAAAHWLPLEQPQRFEALWLDLLRRRPAAAGA